MSASICDTELHVAGLSTQQTAALAFLLSGSTVTDAAREVGVSRVSVSRWLNHDERFQAALRAERSLVFVSARHRVMSGFHEAVQVLRDIMSSEDEPTSERRLAATAIVGLGRASGATDGSQSPDESASHAETLRRAEEILAAHRAPVVRAAVADAPLADGPQDDGAQPFDEWMAEQRLERIEP